MSQDKWRLCKKCQELNYGGNGLGPCAAHDMHDNTGSPDFALLLNDTHANSKVEAGWLWCNKCQALTSNDDNAGSVCPAGGSHNHAGSGSYSLYISTEPPPPPPPNTILLPSQNGWQWCTKCKCLFNGKENGTCLVPDSTRKDPFPSGPSMHTGNPDWTYVLYYQLSLITRA